MKLKIGITLTVLVVIIAIININKFSNRQYIATLGNRKIYKEEFLIYLYEEKNRFEKTGGADIWNYSFDGSNAIDVAKNNALETLYVIKLSNILAKKENVVLTESDNNGVNIIKEQFLKQIPDEVLTETNFESDNITTVAKENLLYLKTFNEMTKDFTYNEADFKVYLEEQYKNDYNYINGSEVVDNNKVNLDELKELYIDKIKKDSFDKKLMALKEEYPLKLNKKIWDSLTLTP